MRTVRGADWTDAELRALLPARRMSVSQWADRYRQLVPPTARTGPWDNGLLPYLVEPMDAVSDPLVALLVLIFAAQCGKTECLLNALGWSIDQDPDPMLVVQPKTPLATAFNLERVRPMIEGSEALARHRTGSARDWTNDALRLTPCTAHFAGAGSPAELAGRAIRRAFLDEVDKFPRWSGREASPVDLAGERLNTYPDSLLAAATTPTTDDGNGWQLFLGTDRRRYHVPCPSCGVYQVLEFEQLKVPEGERDQVRIRRERLAFYECPHCGAEHDDDDENLRRMIDRGVWCPEGGTVSKAGKVRGVATDSDHRGYQLSALYSPIGPNWSSLLALWFKSQGDPTALMNFVNSKLARPFSLADKELEEDDVLRLRDDRPAGRCPTRPDLVLTAGVDVGGPEDGPWQFQWAVRAWAPRLRSWGVAHGVTVARDFREEVLPVILGPWEDGIGRRHVPACVFVDSGWVTPRVMEWTRDLDPQVYPLKGRDEAPVPVSETANGLQILDTNYLKDELAGLIATDPPRWSVHQGIDADYVRHLQSEHRVPRRKAATARGRGGRSKVWRRKAGVGSPHFWDAEVYNLAAAHHLGLHGWEEGDGSAETGDAGSPDPGNPSLTRTLRERMREDLGDDWLDEGDEWL